jgi:hypothetical protein
MLMDRVVTTVVRVIAVLALIAIGSAVVRSCTETFENIAYGTYTSEFHTFATR